MLKRTGLRIEQNRAIKKHKFGHTIYLDCGGFNSVNKYTLNSSLD